MIRRVRSALPTAVVLAMVELALAGASVIAGAKMFDRLTNTGLDPSRVLPAIVEIRSDPGLAALVPSLVAFVVPFVFALVAEPFLTVVFVRAHATPSERGAMRFFRRVLALLVARVVVLLSVGIVLASLTGLGVIAHIGLEKLDDPRPHDLAILGFGLVGLMMVAAGYFVAERVALLVSIDTVRPFEALLDGFRSTSKRFVLARSVTLAASAAFAGLAALGPEEGRLAIAIAAATLVARVGIRSLFFGWAVEDVVARRE